MPSASRASLTSFGTASRDVIPRHASAEGPLGRRFGVTAEELTQKHFWTTPGLVKL